MIILGIMSGTSGDGVDYVWVDVNFEEKLTVKFLKHAHKPFTKTLRDQIKRAVLNEATSYEVGELHHALGRHYAGDYKRLKMFSKLKPHVVGLHGQTIYHNGGKSTLQIGEPTYLAQAAEAPVIFNFRAADIAHGGQGAPLAPVLHKVLLADSSDKPMAFHNLGGISNVTYCQGEKIIAFDTGPASTLMDTWIQSKTKNKKLFDKNGALSAAGVPHAATLKKFMTHPFLAKKAPKSCGREEFNMDFIKKYADRGFFKLSLQDQMATLTEFTVMSIHQAYKKLLPQMPEKIYFSGGGSKNKFLRQRLGIYFDRSQVLTSEDLGWPSEAIEGGAFAVLAYLRLYEQQLDLRTITGAKTPALLGQICEG